MKIYYTDEFVLPLPDAHRFPMAKYQALRERVAAADFAARATMLVPDAATDAQLHRAHSADYVRRVVSGSLDDREIRRLGFPWSPQLVERSRRSVGATIAACRRALEESVAVNLAGGTHHAFPAGPEGYCVFNDAAVAARAMQAEEGIGRVLVVDCDVHQGNGTAAIFADDDSVFTFSIHGEKNFPFRKQRSDLDIALSDGTGDSEYLRRLEQGLGAALAASQPALAVYVSGADPFAGDRLGRLDLSKEGLDARDQHVLSTLAAAGVPVAVVMAGGYAPRVSDIVDIHLATVRAAFGIWSHAKAGPPR